MFFVSKAPLSNEFLNEMNSATLAWTMQAARGECVWICSDCGCSFPKGMPDQCEHNDQRCTDIIKRDKDLATGESNDNSI